MDFKTELLVFNGRLIAFLDVLGFSSRMDEASPAEVVSLYSRFIHEASTSVFDPPNLLPNGKPIRNFAVSKFVFDSIVLVSHPLDDPRNISNFILAVNLLFEMGFKQRLPLRGAIGVGDYIEDANNGVFVSPSFKALFSTEQQLEWSGCCILDDAVPSVLQGLHGKVISPSEAIRNHPVIFCATPNKIKEGGISEIGRWCLNWCYMLTAEELATGLEYMTPTPRKHQFTLNFIQHVHHLPGKGREQVVGHVPPLFMRFMPSTTSCRIRFTDENDSSAEPQGEVHIAFDAEL